MTEEEFLEMIEQEYNFAKIAEKFDIPEGQERAKQIREYADDIKADGLDKFLESRRNFAKKYAKQGAEYSERIWGDFNADLLIDITESTEEHQLCEIQIHQQILKLSKKYCRSIVNKFMKLGDLSEKQAISILSHDEYLDFDEFVLDKAKQFSECLSFN